MSLAPSRARPDRETNNAFVYRMALAAQKSHVSVVCVGTTSNHHHAAVVDNQGRLPEFLEHFHKLFAKHQNCLRGRWEAFWATEPTSIVELPTPDDVLAKLAYAIANACSSHLVEKVHHWPGVESLTAIEEDLSLVASKPSRFFDPANDSLPDVVQLPFHRAPGFERLPHAEYAKLRHGPKSEPGQLGRISWPADGQPYPPPRRSLAFQRRSGLTEAQRR